MLTVPQSLLDVIPPRSFGSSPLPSRRGLPQCHGPAYLPSSVVPSICPRRHPVLCGAERQARTGLRSSDRWEHIEIYPRPKYGLLHGIELAVVLLASAWPYLRSALTYGVFSAASGRRPMRRQPVPPGHFSPGSEPLICHFLRRSFDTGPEMCADSVLPANPNGWNGTSTCVDGGVRHRGAVNGFTRPAMPSERPDGPPRWETRWVARSDFQVFRSRAGLSCWFWGRPRRACPVFDSPAWLRLELGATPRSCAILSDSSDLRRRTAWLDPDESRGAGPPAYLPGTSPLPSEMPPAIIVYKAHEVALDVALEQPGLVCHGRHLRPWLALDHLMGPKPLSMARYQILLRSGRRGPPPPGLPVPPPRVPHGHGTERCGSGLCSVVLGGSSLSSRRSSRHGFRRQHPQRV